MMIITHHFFWRTVFFLSKSKDPAVLSSNYTQLQVESNFGFLTQVKDLSTVTDFRTITMHP